MGIALVFVPASWLMGVTSYLTTDLTPIPLMWIIPLSLYLLSFILAFLRSAAGLVRSASLALPYLIVPLVLVMFAGFVNLFWVPLHLVAFFVGALVCHGTLARLRPPPRDLSLFYITIALGGFLAESGTLLPLHSSLTELSSIPWPWCWRVSFRSRPRPVLIDCLRRSGRGI